MLGFSKKKTPTMEYQFCSVFTFKQQLFIRRYENAKGPNCAVFPPEELDTKISVSSLAEEIEAALSDYRDMGRKVHAEEWDQRNRRLLEYFDESSIAAFERKKNEVTVRRETSTGDVVLFASKDRELELRGATVDQISERVMEFLGLRSNR